MSEPKFNKVKIAWKGKKSRIDQIYSQGLEYAFVTKDNKQIHQLVFCKDFLQDSICAVLNKKRVSIYNFIYDPSADLPVCLDATKILLANWRDKQFRNKIPGCLDFINQIETALKMKKTVVYEGETLPVLYKKSGIWLFVGSKRWMQSPPLISMYTLLLRVGLAHKEGDNYEQTIKNIIDYKTAPYQSNDRSYLRDALPGIKHIISKGDRSLFSRNMKLNYPDSISISTMHNDFGIVGFSTSVPKYYMPNWYKKGTPCL